ncbi:22182_t:CDS:2 [Gigaspora margarita]|uniref:22182_t:CDS:1 n=1 Tax=Gigaspora margarita TaxID=4874 RepID=A0ABN7UNN8_GIGMA|nr:22182_t:CDS:2 [Gigaspora margarita]
MPHTIDYYYLSTQASNIVLEPNLEIENDSSPHIFVPYTQCNKINQTLTTENINNTEPPLQWKTPGSNPYTNYRFLEGDISISKNPHALELHSGLVGAFLETNIQLDLILKKFDTKQN